jgi:WXG100 family type VII secretion target
MSASEVRAAYEELSTIAHRFMKASEKHQQDLQRVQRAATRLHQQGWEGKGSDAFFQEMERVVLPALRRLCTALAQGGTTLQKIQTVMRNAEEEAARLFQGQASGGGETMIGGGGSGEGLGENDVFADDVSPSPVQTLEDGLSVISTAIIAEMFGINLAFPTEETDDMPRYPGDSAVDPAKPQLRSATAEDAEAINQAYYELGVLEDYGVNLTQTGDAHWTPEEIHQVYLAVTSQAQGTYDRAVELGLVDPTTTTPADVFLAVYGGGSDLTIIRSNENTHEGGPADGAYAVWSPDDDPNEIVLYDTAFYARQTTITGGEAGVFFTPSLLIQHEISHQINGLYPTAVDGQSPADYYASQFDFYDSDNNGEDNGMRYTFNSDREILYLDENQNLAVYNITEENRVLDTADYRATDGRWSDYGYQFRARSSGEDYEAVTDGIVAETLGTHGYDLGMNGLGDALWAAARDEVNSYIFDSVLNEVYGE